MELDPRIIRVSIQVGEILKIYEGLAVSATGCKYANANQNECEIKISNLDKETRNYILTATSPFNTDRTPKKVILEAGRVSTGTFKLFVGDIVCSSPVHQSSKNNDPNQRGPSTGDSKSGAGSQTSGASTAQPPDITVTIKALTGDYLKGDVIATNQPAITPLSKIAKSVADQNGLSLNYQATEKNIANYSFTGGKLNQVDKLGECGCDAYVDDENLIVKDTNVPLTGVLRKLDLTNGMIGIPEITEQGIKVKFLLDNQTTLGGALQITSKFYPALNGIYVIYKLSFEIANRDTPFYFIAEAKRISDNG